MFVGRKKELELLENSFSSGRSAFIPIYGRRRVGKSELILKFMEDKPGLYFLGKTTSSTLQMREFLKEAAKAFDEPLLGSLSADSWSDIFSAITGQLKKQEKFVLVIDEFQWVASASPELPSVIQEYWDRDWKNSGRVVLILCGSFIGFMEREVLGRKSPSFGRRTAQIFLRPFPHIEAKDFHPDWSLENQAMAYSHRSKCVEVSY